MTYRNSLLVLGAVVLASAGAVSVAGPGSAAPPSSPAVAHSCATPKDPGTARCFAMYRTGVTPNVSGDAAPAGYGPADLQSAYQLPSATAGAGRTVAIVDAFDDPSAEADLAVYRAQFGLAPCTTDNGCFRKVDQNGATSYPAPDMGWAEEISLDVDMVSAACPACHILLVEANSADTDDLGAGVDTAVALGAKYVSNSYGSSYSATPGSGESTSELQADAFYNHPGVAVVASSGDGGYGVAYPAASPYVTSVGGTSLVRDNGSPRGWSESVWSNQSGGPGSGCSTLEPKPEFQTDSGCPNRTVADVSAVADPSTGVAVYDSFSFRGWAQFGGTSAGSPIIAASYALAGSPAAGTYPNSYPYADAADLNDVTTGQTDECTPSYLCQARPGYDGPTGLGTPHGVAAFAGGPHGTVSGHITNAATGAPLAGAQVSVTGPVETNTVTDAAGRYELRLPVGGYQLDVADYGFAAAPQRSVNVTADATVTDDEALTALRTTTVSGQVTDGSGHGWPLYAKISIDGVPGGPIYTNPFTGAYRVALARGATYTMHVTPVPPGYRSTSVQVGVGSTAVRRNVAVPVDAAACDAPGYAAGVSGTVQSFDTPTAPDGWTVSGAGWTFDDPNGRGNHTGGSGGFAIADTGASSTAPSGKLISPAIDLTGTSTPMLTFDSDVHGGAIVEVETSVDNGTSWQIAWIDSNNQENLAGPQHRVLALPASLAGHTALVRFGFNSIPGATNQWWSVDDVTVGQPSCVSTPAGLVAGTITDATTGQPLDRAGVAVGDGSGISTARPDDPAFPHGLYWLLATPGGAQKLTAAASRYRTATRTVQVNADALTRVSLSLKSGRVAVSAGQLAATEPMGGSATRTVTISNTGTAPAHVTLGDTTGPIAVQGIGAPLQHVPVTRSPTGLTAKAVSPAASGTAWSDLADFPMPNANSTMSAYDEDNGKIYTLGWTLPGTGRPDAGGFYVFDPAVGSWSQLATPQFTVGYAAAGFVDGKFVVAGGEYGNDASEPPPALHTSDKVQIYDPATDTWTAGASLPAARQSAGASVLDGQLYVVGGCGGIAGCVGEPTHADVYRYDASNDEWTTLASYPTPENELACGGLAGELVCAGGNDSVWAFGHSTRASYIYSPATDSWSRAADLPVDLWGMAYSVADGQLVTVGGVTADSTQITNQSFAYHPATGAWSALPNANHPVYAGGSAACGFFAVGQEAINVVSGTNFLQQLPGHSQCGPGSDVSWLSSDPARLTLTPGEQVTVTVTLDGGAPDVTQPGTYHARLITSTDAPYSTPTVQATLTVTPPKAWGEIVGTVTGQRCDGSTVPLAGATVEIDTWAASYTLRTDAQGGYRLWLDRRNNPLAMIVSDDGWQPQSRTVRIKAGVRTTADYTLPTQLSCS